MAAQTRLMDSEKKVALLELENEQLRAEVLKYKSQRNMFHEGMEQEKGAADKLDSEWAEERVCRASRFGVRVQAADMGRPV